MSIRKAIGCIRKVLEGMSVGALSEQRLYTALRELCHTGEGLPKIVCLCGSARFYNEFKKQNFNLTLSGVIVLSIGCDTKRDDGLKITAKKTMLDELHKRKIDLADEILVLNVGGYIGDSTRSEIEYCEKLGKPVRYLEN